VYFTFVMESELLPTRWAFVLKRANILSKLAMNLVDRTKLGIENPADTAKNPEDIGWDELDELD
jgi:hypothetical protein